ncbi:MAG TPA: hypothetical protein VHM94_11085 [Acidimicrobiia bacterium]|nr:hypothetical protein [Acidimicrobiia bacterium]
MCDHIDSTRLDVVAVDQTPGGGLTHHDDPIGEVTQLFHDHALVSCGVTQDGVKSDSGRDIQARHEIEHFDAISAAEYAELVLDRNGVVRIEDRSRRAEGGVIASPMMEHHGRASVTSESVAQSHRAQPACWLSHYTCQGFD